MFKVIKEEELEDGSIDVTLEGPVKEVEELKRIFGEDNFEKKLGEAFGDYCDKLKRGEVSMELISMQEKVLFVEELNEAISAYMPSVDKVSYEIWQRDGYEGYQEYLKIEYKGGAFAVRNSNMNSLGAILRDIGAYIDGGYYAEVDNYKKMVVSEDWRKIL